MNKVFPALILGLLACCCPIAKASKNDFPEWAAAALHNSVPDSGKNHPDAALLYSEHLLTVEPDGKSILRERQVVKILRPQGKEQAECAASYDVEQKLHYMRGWVQGVDGKQYVAKEGDFADLGMKESSDLHESLRTRVLHPPAADPDAVVACEYEIKLRPYINEEAWDFQHSIPLANGIFELDLPPGWQYYAVWKNFSAIKPVEVQPNHWRWELHDIAALDLKDVPMRPTWRSLVARMSVHYGPTVATEPEKRWQQIGTWYQELSSHRTDPSPEISARAHTLADGEKDFFSKIQRVTEDIQKNIRYFVIEIGIGGYQPHFAGDIYRNQYGDCKDKATLLISMLSTIGIPANYVLVDTERGIDPNVPSADADHMIAAIQIPDGYNDPRLQSVVKLNGKRYLIFDPTDTMTPVGNLRSELQNSYALLFSGQESRIIPLPTLTPEANILHRIGTFELTADGTLKGEVIETRKGDSASYLRYSYTGGTSKDTRERLERRLHRDFSSLTVTSEVASHVKDLGEPLELKYDFTAQSYARQAGDLLLVRPRVLGQDALHFDDKPRQYPVDLDEAGTWEDSFDLKLPSGYVADELPPAVSLDTDFASYHSSVTVKGDTLHYKRKYIVKQFELPAEDYPKVTKLMEAILEDEQATAVLKKQ